jgi:nucleoside-diphosphate-sugar epimerase
MKVLIVGGAGYVGGGITDRLIQAGHQVRVYDSLVYEHVYLKPIDFVYGDIREKQQLQPQLDWADVVIWLAALVGDGACSLDPSLTREINVESVKWLTQHFDRRIIFMSTCSVYGAMDGLLTEESPTNPLSLYAETKLEAEKILQPTGAMMFRLGTLFGLGDTYSRIRMDLVVNILTVKACLYRRISVFGGAQYRPLLHVKDVAEAVVANMTTSHTGIYNLHAINMRIVDLAELLMEYVPQLHIQRTAMKFEDSRNYMVSSDKAVQTFGFKPRYTIDDGIREIKTLVEQGRIRDLTSPRFSNTDFLRPVLMTEKTPLGFEVAPPSKLR